MAGEIVRGAARLALAVSVAAGVLVLGPAPGAAADWLDDARRLPGGAASQTRPAGSGNRVVYLDDTRSGPAGDSGGAEQLADVRVLDLGTWSSTRLTRHPTAIGRPAISDALVVWPEQGGRPGAVRLRLYDLATGEGRRLAGKGGTDVAIDGHRACYERGQRVFVRNLRSGSERAVSPGSSRAGACDISGRTVVWQDHRNGLDYDIYSLDLATGRETRLTSHPADQSMPRVSGDVVVWQDQRGGVQGTDIYARNLVTGSETRLSTAGGVQWFAEVDDDRVVWMDERHGHDNTEVYLYDLASRVETRVTNSSGWSGNPAVFGDRIVYEEEVAGARDLYAADITVPDLSVTVQTLVPAGTAPVLDGRLVGADGGGVANEVVQAEYSADGVHWFPAGTAETAHDGRFSLTVATLTSAARLRVWFPGSPEYPPVASREVPITLEPLLLRGVELR